MHKGLFPHVPFIYLIYTDNAVLITILAEYGLCFFTYSRCDKCCRQGSYAFGETQEISVAVIVIMSPPSIGKVQQIKTR